MIVYTVSKALGWHTNCVYLCVCRWDYMGGCGYTWAGNWERVLDDKVVGCWKCSMFVFANDQVS